MRVIDESIYALTSVLVARIYKIDCCNFYCMKTVKMQIKLKANNSIALHLK